MIVQFRRAMAVKVGSMRGSVKAKTMVRIMEATMPLCGVLDGGGMVGRVA
jgi:hypothetical protein